MKIRIRANTLRLRLTQSEVQQLAGHGRVEEVTPFGESQSLRYALCTKASGAISASFAGGLIEVQVPAAQAQTWAEDDTQVGMQEEMPSGESTLSILIEKDFACLQARPNEEDKDTFPNPLAQK